MSEPENSAEILVDVGENGVATVTLTPKGGTALVFTITVK